MTNTFLIIYRELDSEGQESACLVADEAGREMGKILPEPQINRYIVRRQGKSDLKLIKKEKGKESHTTIIHVDAFQGLPRCAEARLGTWQEPYADTRCSFLKWRSSYI